MLAKVSSGSNLNDPRFCDLLVQLVFLILVSYHLLKCQYVERFIVFSIFPAFVPS